MKLFLVVFVILTINYHKYQLASLEFVLGFVSFFAKKVQDPT